MSDIPRKGDIVRNNYAGKGNPNRYLLFLGQGTIKQGNRKWKSYDCIGFNGKRVQFFHDEDNKLEKVGHMEEFDAFIKALQSLKDINLD